MSRKIDHLAYIKYEQYSVRYVISTNQIEKFLDQVISISEEDDYDKISELLNQKIAEECYYLLMTNIIPEFNKKLKHNIELIQKNKDVSYADYLKTRFCLKIDPLNVDLNTWNYAVKKIKIHMKPFLKPTEQKICSIQTTSTLAKMLNIKPDQIFKMKSEIVRLVHKYIHENNLQNTENKQIIDADESLLEVLQPLQSPDTKYTYFNLVKYLSNSILIE